jgi:hypothetical protein
LPYIFWTNFLHLINFFLSILYIWPSKN